MGYKTPIEELNKRIPGISSLTALHYVESHTSKSGIKKSKVLCKCVCGNEVTCVATDLIRGNPLSCGCTSKKGRKSFYTIGDANLYQRWHGMRERCYNRLHRNYISYGARGVKVCDAWINDYIAFAKWSLANGYAIGLELDKDIKGDGLLYSPKTCSWVTHLINVRQKNSTIKLKYKGKLMTISEIALLEGISYQVLLARYNKFKDITNAVNFERGPKKYSNK